MARFTAGAIIGEVQIQKEQRPFDVIVVPFSIVDPIDDRLPVLITTNIVMILSVVGLVSQITTQLLFGSPKLVVEP